MKFIFRSFFLLALCYACTPIDETPEGVKVDFILMDSQGNERYEFQEGEDILFKLEISNESDDDHLIKMEPMDEQLFQVFDAGNNSPLGSPQSQIAQVAYIYFVNGYPVPADTSYTFIVSWLGNESFTEVPEVWRVFYQDNDPLPKGEYTVQFPFNIEFSDAGKFRGNFKKNFTVYE